jgi:hypothetical protein
MKKPKGHIHGETFYPLGDSFPTIRKDGQGFIKRCNIKAQWSREYREPKKGEWYLSGNPVTAYKAPNDLSTKYFIATIVEVKVKTCFEVI